MDQIRVRTIGGGGGGSGGCFGWLVARKSRLCGGLRWVVRTTVRYMAISAIDHNHSIDNDPILMIRAIVLPW